MGKESQVNKRRYNQKQYAKHGDKIRSYYRNAMRDFRLNSPEINKYRALKSSAHKRNMAFDISKEEFLNWFSFNGKRCAYCECQLTKYKPFSNIGGVGLDSLTIDRKDSRLPYTLGNMVFCCAICNRLKSDFFSCDEWREIAQKYIKPKWVAKMAVNNGS